MKYRKWRLVYSFKGLPILSLILKHIADGILIAINEPNIGDIHLTLLNKENRLSWHISDKTVGHNAQKSQQLPLGGQISNKVLQERIEKITKK
ncbi:MAG: hypothetical protein QXH42_04830 [Thermoplasmata archaeon]